MKQNMTEIALLGCGNIGSYLAKELLENPEQKVKLKKALVKDPSKPRDLPASLITTNIEEILADPNIELVVELMGCEEPALDYVLRALAAGKHLVTANKELIAKHGPKIFAQAEKYNRQVRLDATVGGGLPVINTILGSLTGNRITEVVGILNGTTNFMLSTMSEGASFAEALAQAQALGYAEPDPSSDLSGADARYKISIIASLAFGQYFAPSDVQCTGIEGIDREDLSYAEEIGFSVKLLAQAKSYAGNKLTLSVFPTLVSHQNPLSRVDGVLNGVAIRGHLVGELLIVGRGAGAAPTSSALLGDILSIIERPSGDSRSPYGLGGASRVLAGSAQRYYLRLTTGDEIGVIRDLGGVLALHGISLESIVQKSKGERASLVLLTHHIDDPEQFERALGDIVALPQVFGVNCCLRVLD